jgi:hypothetical protein
MYHIKCEQHIIYLTIEKSPPSSFPPTVSARGPLHPRWVSLRIIGQLVGKLICL